MRQTTTTTTTTTRTNEKIDPLMRIQEEIKEVKRREREYRQLKFGECDDHASDDNSATKHHDNDHDNDSSDHLSMSPEPACPIRVVSSTSSAVTLISSPDDNSSLASSVNSKESLDEHHSDDSGISASSSPVNGTSANEPVKPPAVSGNSGGIKEQRYVGPNAYNLTPMPPPQKLVLTRTVSTPQIFTPQRIIAQSPAQKGLMQRFIASRGKLMLNNNNNIGAGTNGNPYYNHNNNNNHNNTKILTTATPPNTPLNGTGGGGCGGGGGGGLNNSFLPQDFNALRNPASIVMPTTTMISPQIERDVDGKPIRRGYVPVEVKIQRELKDYKSRESELKKYRKIRDSTPDLLDSIDMETLESDEEDEVEHCYGPGKLRAAKSIGELCDSMHSTNSFSPRTTPSPVFDNKVNYNRSGGMRPAMSLAQLCDLDPEEAPSSHRLIAQWESIIKQNEQKSERK